MKIRKNRELRELYQSSSISEDITRRRLIWASHAWCKEYFKKMLLEEKDRWDDQDYVGKTE